MNELQILEAIESARGKDKEDILREHSDNVRLRQLLDAALNFRRKFYIKKFNEGVDYDPVGDVHNAFMTLLHKLENRQLTGHAAIASVEQFLSTCDDIKAKWYSRILRKDLKADVGISTINKCGFDIPKFDVQLAKDGNKCKKLQQILSKTVFLSPKLDGYRCLAIIRDGHCDLFSRNGTVYSNFPSIKQSLEEMCPDGDFVFDGEIMSDSFNDMQKSAFASKRGTVVGDVSYHIFDMIPFAEWDNNKFTTKAGQRYIDLDTFFLSNMKLIRELENIKMVFHHKIDGPSMQEIMDYEQACLTASFEGCMLNPDIPYYKGKVSNKMLKFKTFKTWDCKILSFYEGEKGTKNEGKLGGVTVEQENGVHCDVGSGFSDEEREHIWKHKSMYLGKTIEVSYQELTNDKKMRFGTKVRWRHDKD
jgi:DNA ligase 1